MKLGIHIIFFATIFCACANNQESTEAKQSAEKVLESDHKEPIAATPVSDHSSTNIVEEVVKEIEPPSDKMFDTKVLGNEAPKTASTIAQQQEAARKIQEELAARNPQPNENKNLDKAVFEKVVSEKKPNKVEKKAPKPVAKPKTKKPTRKKGKPVIEFDDMKMVFDTITQGDIIDHKFIFTNTGTAALEIKSVNVSCGCTQPSFPFIPIEPNEQGHISVKYNSVGKEGAQSPEVSVLTNIDKNEIILVMEGYVKQKEKEAEKEN